MLQCGIVRPFNFCQPACISLWSWFTSPWTLIILKVSVCVSSVKFLFIFIFLWGESCFSFWFVSCLCILDTTSSSWHLNVLPFLGVWWIEFYIWTSAFCILFKKLLSVWSCKRYLPVYLNFNFWHLCPWFIGCWVLVYHVK